MSRRFWSSALERIRVRKMFNSVNFLIEPDLNIDSDDDSDYDSDSDPDFSMGGSSSDSSSDSSSSDDSCFMSEDSEAEYDGDDVFDDDLIDDAITATAREYDRINAPMEDTTIEWGKKILVEDLSEEHALFHFRFRKDDLQLLVDKLWPRLTEFLVGTKEDYHCSLQLPHSVQNSFSHHAVQIL